MTSGSLYFKLLREDLKRRLWAVALVFLAFFFTLPIGLALNMEEAANTDYYRYNDYVSFVRDSAMTDAQYQSKLMELKTKVVTVGVGYGNEMIAFLMITAAVVIGVSSFAYLHNKKKIDFYHSIPVRRELLFAAQYTGGIFIVGAAYCVNLLLLLGVALSYGIPAGSILGVMAAGWGLNMLYYALMYGTAVAAMMMTGNTVVGLLGTGVFFMFLPSVMTLLGVYCNTFFVTTANNMWSLGGSCFSWGTRYLSPLSVYINSFGWEMDQLSRHVPELICTVLALLAITTLDLELYRKRPSEAAGKAMAFKRTMSPVRILLVLGTGLAGGMFFWMLQSRMRWGIFGIMVSVALAHCIIEIIYHFDFKKLFGHKIQLGFCLAAGVLIFLSFRYDWYGYDSYIPKEDKIASASLEIDMDSRWLSDKTSFAIEDGRLTMEYQPIYEYIEKNMVLTDMDTVMPMVEEGRRWTLDARDERLGIHTSVVRVNGTGKQAASISLIGGADGPASIFIASKTGTDEEVQEERYQSGVTVCYRLTDGRQVWRAYTLPLSAVMDSYEALFSQEEYKEGLYSILSQEAGQVRHVQYREAGQPMDLGDDSRVQEAVLKAYQEDLTDLTVEIRLQEMPVGSIAFITEQEETYMRQERRTYRIQTVYGGFQSADYYSSGNVQYWPLYPSFVRTIALLEEQGIRPGVCFAPENTEQITIDVQSRFYENGEALPEGEELEALMRINSHYREDGVLVFKDPESIRMLMGSMAQEDNFQMNPLRKSVPGNIYCSVKTMDGTETGGLLVDGEVTPEVEAFFAGIPAVVE